MNLKILNKNQFVDMKKNEFWQQFFAFESIRINFAPLIIVITMHAQFNIHYMFEYLNMGKL